MTESKNRTGKGIIAAVALAIVVGMAGVSFAGWGFGHGSGGGHGYGHGYNNHMINRGSGNHHPMGSAYCGSYGYGPHHGYTNDMNGAAYRNALQDQ